MASQLITAIRNKKYGGQARGGVGGVASARGMGNVGLAHGGGDSVALARSGGSASSITADGFLTPDQGRLVGFIASAEYEKVVKDKISLKKYYSNGAECHCGWKEGTQ